VQADLFYTQEQRGDDEIVACYKVSTGEAVWFHRDPVRFYESNGGAGPRATPTLSNGRVYAFGATGILNALDARSGAVVWSRNVASETGTEVPGWGFASSPLVIGDVVIVAADATLAGYDAATGQKLWVGPVHRGSYSSPHRTTMDSANLRSDDLTVFRVWTLPCCGRLNLSCEIPMTARAFYDAVEILLEHVAAADQVLG